MEGMMGFLRIREFKRIQIKVAVLLLPALIPMFVIISPKDLILKMSLFLEG